LSSLTPWQGRNKSRSRLEGCSRYGNTRSHKENDIPFRGYARDGDDAAVKAFAAKTDRTIRMHLSMAQKLDGTVTASAK
jgi:hypothetical protein